MTLEEIANYIVAEGKGILAADESNPTCGKRFESIGVESTEEKRRDYREMLFRSKGMEGNIGGVILFDETIRQSAADGNLLRDIISKRDLPDYQRFSDFFLKSVSTYENTWGVLDQNG